MMEHERRRARMALFMITGVTLVACEKVITEPPMPLVASVEVTPAHGTLVAFGETLQLRATARDERGGSIAGASFAWASDNVARATVDSSGLVTAAGNGTARITATTEGVIGTAAITVAQEVAVVTVTPSAEPHLSIGGTVQLTATAADANGNPMTATFTWKSLLPDIATVDGSGIATVRRSGQAIIAAEAGDAKGYCLVLGATTGAGATLSWESRIGHLSGRYGVWAASPTEVWAVGWGGTIEFYDGVSWQRTGSFVTAQTINDIWGTSASDVWAVADSGIVLHYDGVEWKKVFASGSPPLIAVWASGPSDVWVVGYDWADPASRLLHFDGTRWQPVDLPTSGQPWAVWGASSTDVWVISNPSLSEGRLLHYDGQRWTSESPGFAMPWLTALWGAASDDVWVIGEDATLLHYDGNSWAQTATPLTTGPVYDIHGATWDNIWVVGEGESFHYDGNSWQRVEWPTLATGRSVWALSNGNVWTVGTVSIPGDGFVLRHDGTDWQDLTPGLPEVRSFVRGLTAVWGSGPDHFIAVGDYGQVVEYDRGSWRNISPPNSGSSNPRNYLRGVWGSGPNDVWVVGESGVSRDFLMHYDGAVWTGFNSPNGWDLHDVWGTAPNDVWAVGYRSILQYRGGVDWLDCSPPGFRSTYARFELRAVWGSAPNDVWIVGTNGQTGQDAKGLIYHFDGDSIVDVTPPIAGSVHFKFTDVWGSAPDDVWAISSVRALHFDGTNWSVADPGLTNTVYYTGVWGSGPEDVWVVGSEFLHYDGVVWTKETPGEYWLTPHDIWGTVPGGVWVIGFGHWPLVGLP